MMLALQPKSWISSLTTLLVIFACFVGIIGIQNRGVGKLNKELSAEDYEQLAQDEAVQLDLLSRSPSLGFDNIIADWVYLGFIQYFGDPQTREKTGYGLLPKYYQLLVNKDPRFTDGLSKLDVATSLFGGQPQVSINFLQKALEKIPKKFITNIPPYYLWRAKGNNELLFLGDIDAAKKSYRQSINWAKAYNNQESQRIIQISQNSLDFLTGDPDSQEARIAAWIGVLANRPDEKTVQRVIGEIRALGARVSIEPDGNILISLPKE